MVLRGFAGIEASEEESSSSQKVPLSTVYQEEKVFLLTPFL